MTADWETKYLQIERESEIPLLVPLDTELIKHRARLGIFCLSYVQTASLFLKTYKGTSNSFPSHCH
jgi:hypothetical protein